jgi:hypothetical protein
MINSQGTDPWRRIHSPSLSSTTHDGTTSSFLCSAKARVYNNGAKESTGRVYPVAYSPMPPPTVIRYSRGTQLARHARRKWRLGCCARLGKKNNEEGPPDSDAKLLNAEAHAVEALGNKKKGIGVVGCAVRVECGRMGRQRMEFGPMSFSSFFFFSFIFLFHFLFILFSFQTKVQILNEFKLHTCLNTPTKSLSMIKESKFFCHLFKHLFQICDTYTQR